MPTPPGTSFRNQKGTRGYEKKKPALWVARVSPNPSWNAEIYRPPSHQYGDRILNWHNTPGPDFLDDDVLSALVDYILALMEREKLRNDLRVALKHEHDLGCKTGVAPLVIHEGVSEFCRQEGLSDWLERVLAIVQEVFSCIHGIEVQVEHDYETQDKWVVIDTNVSGGPEIAEDENDKLLGQMISIIPWPERSRFRVILNVVEDE